MLFFRLPEWTDKIYYPGCDLEHLAHKYLISFTQTPEMSRLKFGFLLREILDRFSDKIQSKLMPDRKLWFYSGHDLTIVSLLNIMGVYVSVLFFPVEVRVHEINLIKRFFSH